MDSVLGGSVGRWVLALTLGLGIIAAIMIPDRAVQAAVSGCGCYCGVVLRPPCGDDACKRACGWTGPGNSGSSGGGAVYDPEAERLREEAERQRRLDAERQRQRELEEQWRREDEDAKRRAAEFERNK